ncbi:hypothetical protein ACN47E_008925 [Coniothyrium glycines]
MSTHQAPHATEAIPPPPNDAQFLQPTTAHATSTLQGQAASASTNTATANPPNDALVQPTQSSPANDPQSYNDKLNASDRYWKFKLGLATVLIITGLIGVGCFGWIISSNPANTYSYYGYDSYWSTWPSFVTWAVSIIWCSICIATFLTRKRPVHPGVRVAIDLLLWLGFIVTVMFAVLALLELLDWGHYGDISDGIYSSSSSSNQGDYVLQSNNTWVWEQDSSYITIARSCNSTSSYYSDLPDFKNCEEQDAFINKLWQSKGHRASVMTTGVVCQCFGLLLHFILFVWACVDTHRYNRSKISKDAEKLAAGIVQTMIQNGAVVPPPGQAHVRPDVGHGFYYQLPPQQVHMSQQNYMQPQAFPMANMHPAHRTPPMHQPMVPSQFQPMVEQPTESATGPSGEKGQPRYA